MELKYCPKCEKEKELKLFSNNQKREDGKYRICKYCQSEYDKKHYLNHLSKHKDRRKNYQIKIREWFIEFRKNFQCKKCEEKRHYLIQFHHINKDEKVFNISEYRNGKNKLLKELEKCIPLCSNCHDEFHYFERLNNITIEEYLRNVG